MFLYGLCRVQMFVSVGVGSFLEFLRFVIVGYGFDWCFGLCVFGLYDS